MRTISGLSDATFRRPWAIFLLVLIFAVCSFPASALSEADTCFITAESLVKKKKHKEAIPYFDRAIQLEPNICRFHDERGMALLELEEQKKALADFNTVLKLDPNYPSAYRNRARCYFELGNVPAAIADISTRISLATHKHRRAELLTDRAGYYLSNGQPDKALADRNAAIALEPNNWALYRHRGQTYATMHQYQKAIDDYSRAFKFATNPRLVLDGLHCERARIYEKLGRKDLAAADYKQAKAFADDDVTTQISQPASPIKKPAQPTAKSVQ